MAKVIYLKPCPKCGLPLRVDSRKKYAYCMNSHYSIPLRGVSQSQKFVALSASAEEISNLAKDTASWQRLKKRKEQTNANR